MAEHDETPRLIKRYPGARLYDPQAARYISLQDISDMVRTQQRILVRDAATGQEVTQSVLAPIVPIIH